MKTQLVKVIIALNLSNLKNGKHFNFMEFVATALTLYAINNASFAFFIERFLKAFDRENEVYLKHDRKAMTQQINKAGTLRDEKFRILRDAIKLAQIAAATAEGREAAEVLMGIISLYGGNKIPAMGMDEKSGVLTNFIEDLEEKYNAQVQLLNLGQLLSDLKSANIGFKRLVSLRTEADSKYGKNAMSDARLDTDKAYRMMITAFNQAYYESRDEKLGHFIDYLNTEIERYRIGIGQGAGNADIGGEVDEENKNPDDSTGTQKPEGGEGTEGSENNPSTPGTPSTPSTPSDPDDDDPDALKPGPGGDDPDL